MCGIICFGSSKEHSLKELRILCETMAHRGPDHSHIDQFNINSNLKISFLVTQLMIVGKEPFPIKNDFVTGKSSQNFDFLIGNMEIYNYLELYKQFLENEFIWLEDLSDAHIVIPLLNKFIKQGLSRKKALVKLLSEVKGDYAFTLLSSSHELLIARDHFGIRPLYYCYKSIFEFAFASEPKSLLQLGFSQDEISKVPPGGFTVIDLLNPDYILTWHFLENNLSKICKTRSVYSVQEENKEKTIILDLCTLLEKSVKTKIPSSKFALFLSGGIDSSIIFAFLNKLQVMDKLEIIIVGFEESPDLKYSRNLCKKYGLIPNEVIITEENISKHLSKILKLLRTKDSQVSPVDVSIALPLYFASMRAQELHCKVALTGQGADELFIGYKKYYSPSYISNNKKLLDAVNNDIINLASQNLERDDLITMNFSIEVRFPYLDLEIIEFLSKLDFRLLYSDSELKRKDLLRKVAAKLELPDFIVTRQKKAAQYGTFVMKNLNQLAKPHKSLRKYLDSIE